MTCSDHLATATCTVAGNKAHFNAIDVVYLWVDSADLLWRKRRQHAYAAWVAAHPGELAAFGNVAGRYRDNGELLFNLRALEKFFPARGHIYIVTDNQVPSWLQSSPGLTVVSHQDLVPSRGLGVFDSGHIESYLHHIPGLSEQFFYLNDDVFFGAKVETKDWFGQRLTVFSEDMLVPDYETMQTHETSLVNASIQSRDWMSLRYPDYRHEPRAYSHSPRPMLKSAMFELEQLAPELFSRARSTSFRSWRIPSLVPDLVPRWMVYMGYAEQRILNPLHISTADPLAAQQLGTLQEKFGSLPFFCINDTCDDAADDDLRLRRVADTLDALLPEPSQFEVRLEEREAA